MIPKYLLPAEMNPRSKTKKTMAVKRTTTYTAAKEGQRSDQEATLLHVGIRVKHFLLTWGFTRPFLKHNMNYYCPEKLPFNYFVLMTAKICWVITSLLRQFETSFYISYYSGFLPVLATIYKVCHWHFLAMAKKYLPVATDRPLPEFDWQNKTPEEFYQTFVKNLHPVCCRGFCKEIKAVKKWSFRWFLDNFGDDPVLITNAKKDGAYGKIRDVDDPSNYAQNIESVFVDHPELLNDLEFDLYQPYIKKKVGYNQFFIGRRGTGSNFHSAANWNMFVQVDGQKKWWFINPQYAFFLYPVAQAGVAAGVGLVTTPETVNEKAYPLFKYVPRFSIVLEPGDLMFNPPWWWHCIKNVSEVTVGVATRWHGGAGVGYNLMNTEEDYDVSPLFSLCNLLGYKSVRWTQGILHDPSPKYDEHTTLREKGTRYAHVQNYMAKQGYIL